MFKSLIFSTALILASSCAYAQTPLSAYADPDGYILVKKLTCAQLAGTFQEDADFLGVWYSGWYNGLGKKSALNVPRVKEGIHQVIVFCKDNPDKTIIQAIDIILKREKDRSTR
jgi:HdeA/HdeB family